MLKKRGQVAVFIIIGVVIILSVIFLIIFKSSIFIKKQPLEMLAEGEINSEVIKFYVNNCLKLTTVDAAYLLAFQGGFISSAPYMLETENQRVAYHLIENTFTYPSKLQMEKQMAEYIDLSIPDCIENLSILTGYDIKFGSPKSRVIIEKESIFSELNFPIEISKENHKFIVSDYESRAEIFLADIIKVRDEILKKIKDNSTIDFEELSDYGVEVTILPYDKTDIIYSIYDRDSSYIEGRKFIFNFAVKKSSNSKPRLEFLPDFTVAINKPFEYQVKAYDNDNDKLIFNVTKGDATIDENGVLYFAPHPIGNYEIEICVTDGKVQDCGEMKIMVKYGI